MRICLKLIGIVLFVFLGFAYGQPQPNSGVTAEQRQEAGAFFQKQDWESAAKAYEKIVKLEEKNFGARFRLATALFNLNKLDEARVQLEILTANASNPQFSLMLARIYARQNNKEKTIEALGKMVSSGGVQPEVLNNEKDFTSIKEEARFIEIVKKSDIAVNPCKASPEFRQFDFWIGEWAVKNPQGNPAGTSSIQLILGSCIIFENWTSASGVSGKSFNIYDTNDKKWHQSWVDDKGTFTHYIGGLIDGKMVVVAETFINGKKGLAKMTFTPLPNGDVRQFGENSTDDGKTWVVAFDLTYSRKK